MNPPSPLRLSIAILTLLAIASGAFADEPNSGEAPRGPKPAGAAVLIPVALFPGISAVHHCTTSNFLSKARGSGLGQRQESTITTVFGSSPTQSGDLTQTLRVTTGEFVEEYRLVTPIGWLPYGLSAEERRIPQPGTESGFLWRGTVVTDGGIPAIGASIGPSTAQLNEDMTWATHIGNDETQVTRFSTKKEVTVTTSASIKVANPVLGEVELVHVSVEIRNADTPARQQWTRDYAAAYGVPVSFVRRDFNVKSQPVRELRCELESYQKP